MRRLLPLSFLVFQIVILFGQITVNQSDMPGAGSAYFLSTPDTLLGIDVSLTGTAYQWDLSQMRAIAQQRDSFMAVSGVPFAIRFQFPLTANLAQYLNTPDSLGPVVLGESYRAYEVSATHYAYLGLGGNLNGLPLVLKNNPSDKEYFFPLTYGDEDSSVSVAELNIPGLFYIKQERKRINKVDGWGDLPTPYGTFSTIRVRSQISGFDTLSFDTLSVAYGVPAQIEYKWLGKGRGIPLLRINTVSVDSLGGNTELVTRIQYQDSLRAFSTTGLDKERFAGRLGLYPNPASTQVNLDLTDRLGPDARLEVWDVQGRRMEEKAIDARSMVWDVSAYAPGTYLVRLWSRGQWYTGKLSVVR